MFLLACALLYVPWWAWLLGAWLLIMGFIVK